jgi:hypothetical protein
MASLMSWKDCLAASVHFISESFFNMAVMCLVSSAKFSMNLLTKLMVPRKD